LQLTDNRDRIRCLLCLKEGAKQREKKRIEESATQAVNNEGEGGGLPHQEAPWEKNTPEPV